MSTSFKLTPEKLATYRATAQRRRAQEKAQLDQRREQAWAAARQAAQLLKEEFNANRVVVFGSLARESGFTRWSDVDVAAWGLAPEDTFRAIGAVMDLPTEVPVNLVDVNTCRPALLSAIEQDGLDL
jgi:predicted nucleotidyltransferase